MKLRFPFRFQFSLRTLLIFVTLLAIPCGYVGYQKKIVANRQEMLKKIKEDRGDWVRSDLMIKTELRWPGYQPPWIRRLFGDIAVGEIFVQPQTDLSTVDEIQETFPEALLFEW